MNRSEYEKLLNDPGRGLRELLDLPPMELVLHPVSALCVLAHLQLALRYPDLELGESSRKVRQIAKAIETYLGQASPEMKALAAAGWDKQHDL